MISNKDKRAILKAYYSLDFPGSYGGVKGKVSWSLVYLLHPSSLNAGFHEAVKQHLGIRISEEALRRLLHNEINYQIHYVRKKDLFSRSNYARGSNLEAFCDIVYMPKGEGNKFSHENNIVFLVVLDIFCRYMYIQNIPSKKVNPETLTKAFKALWKKGMPAFPIVRLH